MPVPGAEAVRRLSESLAAQLGEQTVRWVGSLPGDDVDAIGWRLWVAPRYLFSVSTHAGRMPEGRYELQISIVDDSLENGEILFLDEVSLQDACDVTLRYAHGEYMVTWK